ncbi:MAG: PDZ domain-containing protein, partial [Gemmatimonadetes bacterium]|nr:PDZ domain-containing protein [Gemmatimonadota bacterium]
MTAISFLLLLLAVSTATATPPSYRELPADLPCRYGSIGVRPFAAAPDTVAVGRVSLHSPADSAGLLQGDRLIAVSSYRVRTPDELSRCIQSFSPGSTLEIEIQRQQQSLTLSCTVTDVRRLYFLMGEQKTHPGIPPAPRHRRWSARVDALEKASLNLISRSGANAEHSAFLDAMADELDRYAGDCRLRDVHHALLHPFKGSQIARELTGEFSSSPNLETYLAAA